ncbi:fibronectin type III domain-containing protein [Arsenicibacter rosenii]|nr:fibronectin type III domain-containing protein [Arsenicibacter rosenii]
MNKLLPVAYLCILFAVPPRIVKGPYIQNLTENSVTICWHTDGPANSRVLYGLRMNQLNGAIFNNQQLTDHYITLSNLEPGTRYFYSFGSSGARLQADSTQHFTTGLKKNKK